MGNDKIVAMLEFMFKRVGYELKYHLEQYTTDDVKELLEVDDMLSEEVLYNSMFDLLVLVSTKLGIHVNEWKRGVAIYNANDARFVATAMNFEVLEVLWLVILLGSKHIPIFRDAKSVTAGNVSSLIREFCYLAQIQDTSFLSRGDYQFSKANIAAEKIMAVTTTKSIPQFEFSNSVPIWLNSTVSKEMVTTWTKIDINPWVPKELNEIEHFLNGLNAYINEWDAIDDYYNTPSEVMTKHISYLYTVISSWNCKNLCWVMGLNSGLFEEYSKQYTMGGFDDLAKFVRYRDELIIGVVDPMISGSSTIC